MVKVSRVAGEQRKIVRQGGRSDQQIHRTCTAGLALTGTGRGVDDAIGAGSGHAQTRTLVFSQVASLVAIAALVFSWR